MNGHAWLNTGRQKSKTEQASFPMFTDLPNMVSRMHQRESKLIQD